MVLMIIPARMRQVWHLLTPNDTLLYLLYMVQEIKTNGVYTTQEVEGLLKISNSTVKRLLKKGILRANKVGKQYRVLGKEILRLISPEVEKKAINVYLGLKKKAVNKIEKW